MEVRGAPKEPAKEEKGTGGPQGPVAKWRVGGPPRARRLCREGKHRRAPEKKRERKEQQKAGVANNSNLNTSGGPQILWGTGGDRRDPRPSGPHKAHAAFVVKS